MTLTSLAWLGCTWIILPSGQWAGGERSSQTMITSPTSRLGDVWNYLLRCCKWWRYSRCHVCQKEFLILVISCQRLLAERGKSTSEMGSGVVSRDVPVRKWAGVSATSSVALELSAQSGLVLRQASILAAKVAIHSKVSPLSPMTLRRWYLKLCTVAFHNPPKWLARGGMKLLDVACTAMVEATFSSIDEVVVNKRVISADAPLKFCSVVRKNRVAYAATSCEAVVGCQKCLGC